ncbi:hypothetical protein FLK61_34715 [Paenalkalicoccus suaedae]|uniref:Uncharacterized protein n=1 Tax=Paenalkalicoccus suaedae TaxID=2592382 RepID=A0A859FGN7_9BACI|nr:hypothetical protein [Paenalkalicoccus suaedae]QKS71824.1 hypothetical protein FLK61_34715 [Paenalkalicoccus suaedae]
MRVYTVKVELKKVRPPVWRRFKIRGDITLRMIAYAILRSFEWNKELEASWEEKNGNVIPLESEDAEKQLQDIFNGKTKSITLLYGDEEHTSIQLTMKQEHAEDSDTEELIQCTGAKRLAPQEEEFSQSMEAMRERREWVAEIEPPSTMIISKVNGEIQELLELEGEHNRFVQHVVTMIHDNEDLFRTYVALMENYYKEALWSRLSGNDVICVKLSKRERWYVSVLGKEHETYGLAAYEGIAGKRLFEKMFRNQFFPFEPGDVTGCIATFTDVSLLNQFDFILLDYFDKVKLLTDEHYPGVQMFAFGELHEYPTVEQIKRLCAILEALMQLGKQIKSSQYVPIVSKNRDGKWFVSGEEPFYSLRELDEKWRGEIAYEEASPLYINEVHLQRLKKFPRANESVQVEMFYHHTPLQEGFDAVFPVFTVIIDHESGEIIEHDISTRKAGPKKLQHMFANWCIKNGQLPREVIIQDPRSEAWISPLLDKVQIPIRSVSTLTHINEFRLSLLMKDLDDEIE